MAINWSHKPVSDAPGLGYIGDILEQIAKRRAQLELAEMEDARVRDISGVNDQRERLIAAMKAEQERNALAETARRHTDQARHEREMEDIDYAKIRDAKAKLRADYLGSDPVQQALRNIDLDPRAIDRMSPVLKEHGLEVRKDEVTPQAPPVGPTMPQHVAEAEADRTGMRKSSIVDPKSGDVLSTIDPASAAAARAQMRQRRQDEEMARLATLPNDYDRIGAIAGASAEDAALAAGVDPAKAREAGQRAAGTSSGQLTSRVNSAGMQQAIREGRETYLPFRQQRTIDTFVADVERRVGQPKLRQDIASNERFETLLSKLGPNSGIADVVAVGELAKSLYGAAQQSEKEGARLFNAGGIETRIENSIQRLINGQWSEDYRRDLQELGVATKRHLQTRFYRNAHTARKLAEKNGIIRRIPGGADYVYEAMTGADQGGGVQLSNGGATSTSASTSVSGEPAARAAGTTPSAPDDDDEDAELEEALK